MALVALSVRRQVVLVTPVVRRDTHSSPVGILLAFLLVILLAILLATPVATLAVTPVATLVANTS